MNETIRKQLVRARTALYIEDPFYGILALRLKLVEKDSIKTLCVSHSTIYYNPHFVETLSPALTKSAIAHEIGHIIYDHIDRRCGRDPHKWNCAGDYVINAVLHNTEYIDGSGKPYKAFEIGKNWLYNPAFEGMTSDHIYTLLPDDDGSDPLGEMQEGEGFGDETPEEREAARLDWKIAATQAAAIAQKQGKLPADMARFVEAMVDNKVDWRARLRKFATEVTKADTSWTRAQRRMVPFGYYLPSLHSEAMGTFVSGIDTSGSIDDYTLQMFAAEIQAIRLATTPLKMVNIYCDAEVAHVDEYDQTEELAFKGHGGGGTDFRPVFDYVEENDVKPACLIYLTDGYGPFPDSPPPYPVLWVMTTDVVAPWGETVRIEA